VTAVHVISGSTCEKTTDPAQSPPLASSATRAYILFFAALGDTGLYPLSRRASHR